MASSRARSRLTTWSGCLTSTSGRSPFCNVRIPSVLGWNQARAPARRRI